jgi:hypothetical protein
VKQAAEEVSLQARAWAAAPVEAEGTRPAAVNAAAKECGDGRTSGYEESMERKWESAAARERVEEGVPGGDVANCVRDVGEHGEGGVEEGPREGAVEVDEGDGDGRVGSGVGLDRPCVEGLAVAGAGGCAAEVLHELHVIHAPCGRRPVRGVACVAGWRRE